MKSGKQKIDQLRQADGCLTRDAILKIIPYQDPFVFVDQVNYLDESSIESEYYVREDLQALQGHFVGFPVMPGALMAEGAGQTGSILLRYKLEDPDSKDILICRIEDARFRSHVIPNTLLTYRLRLGNANRMLARLQGEVFDAEQKVASFKMMMAIVDRDVLRNGAVQDGLVGHQAQTSSNSKSL